MTAQVFNPLALVRPKLWFLGDIVQGLLFHPECMAKYGPKDPDDLKGAVACSQWSTVRRCSVCGTGTFGPDKAGLNEAIRSAKARSSAIRGAGVYLVNYDGHLLAKMHHELVREGMSNKVYIIQEFRNGKAVH